MRVDRLPCADRDARTRRGHVAYGRAYVVHRDAQVGAGLHGLRCPDCRRELFDGRRVLVHDVVEHPCGAARLAQCLDAVGVLAPFGRAQLLGQRIAPADKLLERSTVDRE
jgi:hypothetical protein